MSNSEAKRQKKLARKRSKNKIWHQPITSQKQILASSQGKMLASAKGEILTS